MLHEVFVFGLEKNLRLENKSWYWSWDRKSWSWSWKK